MQILPALSDQHIAFIDVEVLGPVEGDLLVNFLVVKCARHDSDSFALPRRQLLEAFLVASGPASA